MHVPSVALPLLAAMPLASAQLHQYAKKAGLMYFGAATDSPGQRERAGFEAQYSKYDAILKDLNEFGQTTPTNGQKWLFTEPEPGVFNFTEGDIVAKIAKETGQVLRCHALVWHSQLAPWVETTNWTAETLTATITRHIEEVAGHYKGQCYAWDVVNEALNEDGTYRESIFYKVLGEDYIKLAFKVASKVDPDTKLYYNDYNLESVGPKSEAARKIVRMLRADGIKIDGIGMQAHLIAHQAPTLEQQVAVIKSYAEEKVEVALTELDVRIEMPVNDTNMAWQKKVYHDSVAACAMVDACVGVTVWDFYDPFSWVPYVFDGEGAALLWFEDFTKHPAYDGAIDALKANAEPPKCKARRRRSSTPASSGTKTEAPKVERRMVQHPAPVAQAPSKVAQRAHPMRRPITRMVQNVSPMAQGVHPMKKGVTGMSQDVRAVAQKASKFAQEVAPMAQQVY